MEKKEFKKKIFEMEITASKEKAVEIFRQKCLKKFSTEILQNCDISVTKDVVDPRSTIGMAWILSLIKRD